MSLGLKSFFSHMKTFQLRFNKNSDHVFKGDVGPTGLPGPVGEPGYGLPGPKVSVSVFMSMV